MTQVLSADSGSKPPCDSGRHEFEARCRGWRCAKCGLLYAYGHAPWDSYAIEDEKSRRSE